MEFAMTRLQNGQAFPAFDVPAVGGGTISIRQSLQGSYGIVLILPRGVVPLLSGPACGVSARK
jgi:hypothetical protein